MEKTFEVQFRCRPYVKRYIEITFGNPADLPKDRVLYDIFRLKLRKMSVRYDKRCANLEKYSAEIGIKISRDDCYRYGMELSVTDTVAVNRILQGQARALLYKTVGLICNS